MSKEGSELTGGSKMAVRCGWKKSVDRGAVLPYRPTCEGFIGVGIRMRRAAQQLAAGCQSENVIADGTRLKTFSFGDLLHLLASAVHIRIWLVHTPASLSFALTRLVGLLLRDVVLSREEVDGLMAGLLMSNPEPSSATRLKTWLHLNATNLGLFPVSEPLRNHRW